MAKQVAVDATSDEDLAKLEARAARQLEIDDARLFLSGLDPDVVAENTGRKVGELKELAKKYKILISRRDSSV